MNIVTKLFNEIMELNDKHKQEKEDYINQQRIKKELQKYWDRYWLIALTMHEAVKENDSLIAVEAKKMPIHLFPRNHSPVDWNTFDYRIARSRSNEKGTENSVQGHKVVEVLTDHFTKCDYLNFKITYDETSDYYNIRVTTLNAFRFGRVLEDFVGLFVFTTSTAQRIMGDYMTNSCGHFGLYDINFFNGMTLSGLRAYAEFEIYKFGTWYKTAIIPDQDYNPMLRGLNCHPDALIGSIARIIRMTKPYK